MEKNERFSAARSLCRQNLNYETSRRRLADRYTSKVCTKKRAARAARLFFLIQQIKLFSKFLAQDNDFPAF